MTLLFNLEYDFSLLFLVSKVYNFPLLASHCNPSHGQTVLRGNKATAKPASRGILRVFLCPSFYLDYGAGPFFKRTCKGLVLEEGKEGERGNLYASRRFSEDEEVHHGAFVEAGA